MKMRDFVKNNLRKIELSSQEQLRFDALKDKWMRPAECHESAADRPRHFVDFYGEKTASSLATNMHQSGVSQPRRFFKENDSLLADVRNLCLEMSNQGHKNRKAAKKDHLFWQHPLLLKMAAHPPIVEALKDILGPNIKLMSSSLIRVDPQNSIAEETLNQKLLKQSTHSDSLSRNLMIYDEPQALVQADPSLVNVWISLNGTNPKKSPLQTFPGTHRLPIYGAEDLLSEMMQSTADTETKHLTLKAFAFAPYSVNRAVFSKLCWYEFLLNNEEAKSIIDSSNLVEVDTEPGEGLLFSTHLAHGSWTNLSDDVRLAVAFRYSNATHAPDAHYDFPDAHQLFDEKQKTRLGLTQGKQPIVMVLGSESHSKTQAIPIKKLQAVLEEETYTAHWKTFQTAYDFMSETSATIKKTILETPLTDKEQAQVDQFKQSSSTAQIPYALNASDLDFFDDYGVLGPVNLSSMTTDRIQELSTHFNWIKSGNSPHPGVLGNNKTEQRFNQFLSYLCWTSAELLKTAVSPDITQKAQSILGPHVSLVGISFFEVPPSENTVFQTVHNDVSANLNTLYRFGSHPSFDHRQVLRVWISLSGATPGFAPLNVYPGSHRLPLTSPEDYFQSFDSGDDLEFASRTFSLTNPQLQVKAHHGIHQLHLLKNFPEVLKNLRRTEIYSSPGQGIFFDTQLLHGSSPNHQKQTRLTLALRFDNALNPRHPNHLAPMSVDFLRVLYSPEECQKLGISSSERRTPIIMAAGTKHHAGSHPIDVPTLLAIMKTKGYK